MINQPRKTVSCCISASSLLCIAYIFISLKGKNYNLVLAYLLILFDDLFNYFSGNRDMKDIIPDNFK